MQTGGEKEQKNDNKSQQKHHLEMVSNKLLVEREAAKSTFMRAQPLL